jgi:hypothetical protein
LFTGIDEVNSRFFVKCLANMFFFDVIIKKKMQGNPNSQQKKKKNNHQVTKVRNKRQKKGKQRGLSPNALFTPT